MVYSLRWLRDENHLFLAASVAILLHVVDAALFHANFSALSALIAIAAAAAALAAAVRIHAKAGWPLRALLAFGLGLPAFVAGAGIHWIHAAQYGLRSSDYTGVAMMAAGIVLLVDGFYLAGHTLRTWTRRLLVVLLVAGAYFVFPLVLGLAYTTVARLPVCCETPADYGLRYESVSLTAGDGLRLGAWYIPSRNGAAIITAHGGGSNRVTTLDHDLMLARNGYGVLAVDIRGYGESEGHPNALGWNGARDIPAAVDFLEHRADVQSGRIGALGLSLGAEILLTATAQDSRIRAVVSDGATYRSLAEYRLLLHGWDRWLLLPQDWVLWQATALLGDAGPPPSLRDLIASISPRAVMLIAADDRTEHELSQLYYEAAGEPKELWEPAGVEHTLGLLALGPEYESRVVSFFDRYLLGKSP